MKAVVQRVKSAGVAVEDSMISTIGTGLLILLGVQDGDTQKDVEVLVEKIINLRIFEDDKGKMNISLKDVNGEMLVVSQFTLLGDCRKGRRPSFIKAAPPGTAKDLYDYFVKHAIELGVATKSGVFQAMMEVTLTNSGPVTLILDTTSTNGNT